MFAAGWVGWLGWLGVAWLGLICCIWFIGFVGLALLAPWLGLFYNDSYHDSCEFLIIAYWLMFKAYSAYNACLVIP